MDFSIKGKKAIVCAASRGLGKAIANALALEGVELLMCAREGASLEDAAGEIEAACGFSVHRQVCDLSETASRRLLIEQAGRKLGNIDILVHNVGGPKTSLAADTTAADWEAATRQLLLPVVDLNNAFLHSMRQRQWGRILCVTSLSVMEPIANLALSNGIRAAVTGMLKTLADEVARDNVTINCLAPGLIRTQRTEDLMKARIEASGQTEDEYMADYVKSIPAGRLGDPDEFGAVAAFLCSQQASYITGSTICVDGGKRRSTT